MPPWSTVARKGVVMVADVENQKTPLVTAMEMGKPQLRADSVNELLERDDDAGLRQLVQRFSADQVRRPQPLPSQAAHIVTSLHIAAQKGKLKCMRVLLENSPSADVLDAPDQDGNTPLMAGVKEAQHEAVKMLLEAGAHVNARNNKGQSALHLITIAIHKNAKSEEALQKTADLLLGWCDIDLEAHNGSGLTALAAAARYLPEGSGAPRSGILIKFCRNLVSAGASLEETVGSEASEDVLRRKQALTAVLMGVGRGDPLPRPALSRFLDMLVLRKNTREIKDFMPKDAANCRLGSKSLLFHAVDSNDEELVRLLLEKGANAWAVEITKVLPIYRAAAKGHVPIFELLLESMKTNASKKLDLKEHSFHILKKLIENSRRLKGAPPDIDHLKCLERLLQNDIILNLNQTFHGQTILHEAASFNNQDMLCQLLSKGAFLGARRKVNDTDRGIVLPSLLPSTLEDAMDNCISNQSANSDEAEAEAELENMLSDNYTLKLDYRFLLAPGSTEQKVEDQSISELETLMDLSKSRQHRNTIKHPLVETFLYAKWRKALPYYLANLALYFTFVLFLTAFVYSLKDLRILEAKSTSNSTLTEEIETQQTIVNSLMGILIPFNLYMMVRELFQMRFTFRTYFTNVENLLEWFLVIVVFVLCFTTLAADTTRHLAAWAMIVAWYEFVLILGRAPLLAKYVRMLRHVSYNFLMMILLYGALLLAFTISFNIILQPTEAGKETEFTSFWTTLPKALVMATGEFEYSDLNGEFSKQIMPLMSAILVFLLFVFVIFLVLMNVMNGLAVTDTQQVVSDAALYSLLARLELVYLIESFLRCPGMQRLSSHFRLLSGPYNTPFLYAKINKRNKGERLESGKSREHLCRLDGTTSDNLRMRRQEYLEEEKRRRRGDPAAECLSILREIAKRHPEVLQEVVGSSESKEQE
ncbi:transient receptor potential channel pyrexia-like isoform X2 [Penaeus japonicus]|uniref:transient receptor potential channel pyrexia-like isoform X2 n=1 Tax=Penaeus japonicus TaxID=27405 RepID=UPI001C70D76C|nr:transient receptor potential channel pyrexia-like isoform X2 [Penaeus japonicus]